MWRKSSKSNTGGQCVEVRRDLAALRDSKHPNGPTLPIRTLPAFIKGVKIGVFGH
jgi:Domain of unknown function (DUF397)